MPEKNPPAPPAGSAFEIITPSKSKKTNPKSIIIILLVFVFLAGAIFLGVTLVKQNQDVRERAAGNCDNPASIVQCPRSDGNLVSCTPPDANNNAQISTCNSAGRVEDCGGSTFCCPSAGSAWTTNMTACAVATPSPTATSTATASPTATATATASPTATPAETIEPLVSQSPTPTGIATATPFATPKSTSTPVPIPATGTGWPTYLGVGVGVFVIIASILLAI